MVRCRVLAVEPLTGRLRLSLAASAATNPVASQAKKGGDACGGLQPGDLVEGQVVGLAQGPGDQSSLQLTVWGAGAGADRDGAGAAQGAPVAARLELPGHLSDHPAGAAALRPLLTRPGSRIGEWPQGKDPEG